MILNIQETYSKIESDIIENKSDVFKLYNLYTRKYSKYSDRLNNCNVGLFLNDNLQPTVQIYLKNKTGYIKKHLIFNKEGSDIIDIKTLNYKLN